MKKKILLVIFSCLLMMSLYMTDVQAKNINSPYYTYTADSNGELIQTTDAYTPNIQINKINGETLQTPEHIYVDNENYIYISDSKLRKVFILDSDYNYVASLTVDNRGFLPKSTFVSNDKIYVVDFRASSILVFDKYELINNNNVTLLQTVEKPSSPVFENGYKYKPEHIVVDPRGNIYVQGVESTNGLMMLDESGNFMTFFGGNPVRIPIVDQIRSFFLTETQEEKMYKIFPDVPSNIAIDSKGYIYTVTSSLEANPIKKFNVSGTNYFKNDMIGTTDMVSIAIGQYKNIFSVNTQGQIFEYDANGQLLFLFGGKDVSNNRNGLLSRPVSIAVSSKDDILVVDQGTSIIQVYKPTHFTNQVHSAISSYQDGDYDESRDKWNYILQYNALFDYAHIGLGEGYLMDKLYSEAYQEFNYALHYEGMSKAYWGIRQQWMKDNLSNVLLTIVIIIVLRIAYIILNKKYDFSEKINKTLKRFRSKNRLIDELLYIFTFLKHPFDGFYEIKSRKRVSSFTATVIFLLLALVFILNYQFASNIFVPKIGVNISYELSILVFIIALWMIANYLVCSISDGEGSFKNVYQSTAFALSPLLVFMPILIVLSNVITFQERIFYDFGYTVIYLWTAFLLFFMIKDIHNYEVKETIGVIIKSLFTLLIMVLILFLIHSLSTQLFSIIKEIIVEVVNR